jgi:hypothetical protein
MAMTCQVGELTNFDPPGPELTKERQAIALALSGSSRAETKTHAMWPGKEHGSKHFTIVYRGQSVSEVRGN